MPAIANKARFSVRNWREYNASLVVRGSMTIWFSEEALANWYHENGEGKRGRPFTYSDSTMETFLAIRELLRLPYRQTEGFVRSILSLVTDGLSVPDFTSAAKRAAKLGIGLPVLPRRGHVDVVLDSTGLKVFGEGEWKVRQHGPSKRRTWRKLHLAVDPATQEIVAEVLTTNAAHDADLAEALLGEAPEESIRSLPMAFTTSGRYTTRSSGAERGRRFLPDTTPKSSGTPTRSDRVWRATRPFA